MSVMESIKEHPFLIGGAAVLLILLMRSGGSSSSGDGGAAFALQQQAQAGAIDVQLAGVNAAVAANHEQRVSEMYTSGVAAAASIKQTQTAGLIAAFSTLMAHEDNQAAIAANAQLGHEQIQAAQEVSATNNLYQLLGLQNTISGNVKMTQMLSDSSFQSKQQDLMGQQQILDYQRNTLPSLLQHAENLQKLAGDTSVTLATVGGDTAKNIAAVQGNTAQAIAQINGATSRANVEAQNYAQNQKANSDTMSSLAKIGTMIMAAFI